MQHHQHGGEPPGGGGAAPPGFGGPVAAEAAPPLSTRPPMDAGRSSFHELAAVAAAAGEEAERVGGGGAGGLSSAAAAAASNRWPREETLALIRIRSEMDGAFRDATLKGPLWEDVSRSMAELGYQRSAKKCKEKFENVHKYYKRTKDGRAGRQDGKSYRFFSQLEAFHAVAAAATSPRTAAPPPAFPALPVPPAPPIQPTPISAAAPEFAPLEVNWHDLSFSSMSSWESEESDDDGGTEVGGKRKRDGTGSGRSAAMSFLEGVMKQVMERQEAMQQRFLETLERREQERTAREEAWRRQEVARLNREQETLSQERAAAASRDAAIVAFLQRMGSQPVPVAAAAAAATPSPAPAKPPMPDTKPMLQTFPIPAAPLQQHPPQHSTDIVQYSGGAAEPQDLSLGDGHSPSRWPKAEVHALIELRTELEARFADPTSKGSLWEEMSARMRQLGYHRNAKRCKEKWENINKYFKKVKESNRKRAGDSKTCPYFSQLDEIYRKKRIAGACSSGNAELKPAACSGDDNGGGAVRIQTSNGGATASLNADATEKPEDILTAAAAVAGLQSGDIGYEFDCNDEDDDDGKDSDMQFRLQFHSTTAASHGPAVQERS